MQLKAFISVRAISLGAISLGAISLGAISLGAGVLATMAGCAGAETSSGVDELGDGTFLRQESPGRDRVPASASLCGDGTVSSDEACDDGNRVADDGCDACVVATGFACTGAPSACAVVCGDGIVLEGEGELCDDHNPHPGDGCDERCQPEPGYCCEAGVGCVDTTYFALGGTPEPIPDDGYDGTVESMACIPVAVAGSGSAAEHCNHGSIGDVNVEVAIDHPNVGELTIKLVSPLAEVTTLMSVPGYGELSDNGKPGKLGHAARFVASAPIHFDDQGLDAVDAEDLGASLAAGEPVCLADNRCIYTPNAGAGPGHSLADFMGAPAGGTWQLCVGDSAPGGAGALVAAGMQYLPE